MKLMHSFGLGDLAHWAFRPVAWLTDLAWGTDLLNCDKCAERRRKWNALASVPRWLALIALLTGGAIVAWLNS